MSLLLDRFSLNLGQTLLKNSNEHNAPIANTVGQAEGLIQIIYFLESRFQNSSPNPALLFFIVNASVLIPSGHQGITTIIIRGLNPGKSVVAIISYYLIVKAIGDYRR